MGQLLYYSAVGGIVLSVLYITYKWCMSAERMHSFNRATLLALYAVSFGLFPLLDRIAAADSGQELRIVSAISIPRNGLCWIEAVAWGYVAGVCAMLAASVLSYIRIAAIVRRGEAKVCGRYKVVLTDDSSMSPFSWFRYIVLSRSDYNEAGEMIVCHEMRHLDSMHWLDLILAQLVIVFNWYNPTVWLMRRELRTVHEYQADMAVLHSGANAKDYQLLLIRKAVGKKFPALVNSLNHGMLKKRIDMMLSDRRCCRVSRLRAAMFLPAVLVAVALINVPAIGSPIGLLRNVNLYSRQAPPQENALRVGADKLAPEIYLDGEIIDNDDLQNINPSEIKSMSVDKSTPNGRIIINTK